MFSERTNEEYSTRQEPQGELVRPSTTQYAKEKKVTTEPPKTISITFSI
jgi:hypothetical protein